MHSPRGALWSAAWFLFVNATNWPAGLFAADARCDYETSALSLIRSLIGRLRLWKSNLCERQSARFINSSTERSLQPVDFKLIERSTRLKNLLRLIESSDPSNPPTHRILRLIELANLSISQTHAPVHLNFYCHLKRSVCALGCRGRTTCSAEQPWSHCNQLRARCY